MIIHRKGAESAKRTRAGNQLKTASTIDCIFMFIMNFLFTTHVTHEVESMDKSVSIAKYDRPGFLCVLCAFAVKPFTFRASAVNTGC
jgi:hypothetical protein